MVQDFINKHFFNLLIFTLTFGILLYDLIGFDYTDEFCALILFILFGFYLFKTPNWRINKAFLFTLGVFIFYLSYSFYIGSNVKAAIISDCIIQIKPYLAFFCVYSMAPIFSQNQKIKLKLTAVFFWMLLLILGCVELFYPGTIKLTMGHVAYYAAAIISLSLCYLLSTNFNVKNKLIFLLLLAVGIISGRAKFYGFFTFAIVVILYFSNTKNLKFDFKTILVLVCMLSFIIFIAWSKIELYFLKNLTVESDEKDLIARFVLYSTSIDIFKDYFPFGSGFGSFATYSSGVYYSDIYAKYGIEGVWGISRQFYSFIADTYYPSLAQVGVVGVILYITFWFYIVVKAYKYFKINPSQQVMYFTMVLLITGFFGIEGTSDSTFTTHRGFFILMILGLALTQMRDIAQQNLQSKTHKLIG